MAMVKVNDIVEKATSVLSFSPTSVNRENSMENNGKIGHLLFYVFVFSSFYLLHSQKLTC